MELDEYQTSILNEAIQRSYLLYSSACIFTLILQAVLFVNHKNTDFDLLIKNQLVFLFLILILDTVNIKVTVHKNKFNEIETDREGYVAVCKKLKRRMFLQGCVSSAIFIAFYFLIQSYSQRIIYNKSMYMADNIGRILGYFIGTITGFMIRYKMLKDRIIVHD